MRPYTLCTLAQREGLAQAFPLTALNLPAAVHFWAPTFKWGLVVAGLADINRPVEKVSTAQQSGTPPPRRTFQPSFENSMAAS